MSAVDQRHLIRLEANERCIILPYDFGEHVVVGGKEGLSGQVTGYCIKKGYLDIEVAWFSNGDAKTGWFPEWRVGLQE
jgi:hypothetical protein